MIGPKFFVAFYFDLGHDFEAGLEVHPFALMHMQIRDPRLRNRNQPLAFRFLPEVLGHQSVHNVVLNILSEALTDDRRRHMPAPKTRNAGEFLILLNQGVSFARHFFGWNF